MRAVVFALALLLAGCAEVVDPLEERPPDEQPAHGPPEGPAADGPPEAQDTVLEAVVVEETALPAEATLRLGAEDAYALRLGSGWGRIVLESDVSRELHIEMRHDVMEDLAIFTDAGEGWHDEQNHTAVHLFEEEESFVNGFMFVWWGTPGYAFWPSGSNFEEPFHDTINIDAGTRYLLVVSNNVEGYTLHLGDGGEARTWGLGSHPEYTFLVPEEERTAVMDEDTHQVERNRLWSVPERQYGPAIFTSHGWNNREQEPEVYAGLGYDRVGFRNEASQSPLDELRTPLYGVAPWGTDHFSFRAAGQSQEPIDLELFRERNESKVGVEATQRGAGFLVIPLTPS